MKWFTDLILLILSLPHFYQFVSVLRLLISNYQMKSRCFTINSMNLHLQLMHKYCFLVRSTRATIPRSTIRAQASSLYKSKKRKISFRRGTTFQKRKRKIITFEIWPIQFTNRFRHKGLYWTTCSPMRRERRLVLCMVAFAGCSIQLDLAVIRDAIRLAKWMAAKI